MLMYTDIEVIQMFAHKIRSERIQGLGKKTIGLVKDDMWWGGNEIGCGLK